MTTLTTQERIEAYEQAYLSCHGKLPYIRQNGAWIKINNSHSSFRSSDLPAMTLRLIEMTVKKKQEKEKQKLIQETKNRDPKWKEISDETISLFLNKLFEKCDHSTYKMERCMMNLACNNLISDGLEPECDCEDCEIIKNLEKDLKEETNYLSNIINELEVEKRELKEERDELKEDIINLTQENKMLIEKNKHLKDNSVLFSMEDFSSNPLKDAFDPDPIEYIDNDDEIPF